MSWLPEPHRDTPVYQALTLNAAAVDASKALHAAVADGHSTLTPVQEEAIAVVVSVANRCRY
jgi:alkylhydroperoxidase family enzyme